MAKILDWFVTQEARIFTRDDSVQPMLLRFRFELLSSGGEVHHRYTPLWDKRPVSAMLQAGWQPEEDWAKISKPHTIKAKTLRLTRSVKLHYDLYDAPDAATGPIDRLLDAHAIPPGELAVDFGTGDGLKFKHILTRAPHQRAIGLDLYQRRLPDGIEYQKADLDAGPIPILDGSADLVCMIDATAVITNPIAGLESALSIIRPGGHLLYVDRNTSNEYFDRCAGRLGIRVLQSFEMPVTIPNHANVTAEQIADKIIADSADALRGRSSSQIRGMRDQLVREHQGWPTKVFGYVLPYFCVLARKD
jgi:SAM-dependent methyltransferase